MQPYTAGEVNASIARAIAKFQRNAGAYGPDFQDMVNRIIAGSQGFGDGEDTSFLPAQDPSLDYTNSVPSFSFTNPASSVSVVPPNVVASASTVPINFQTTLNSLVAGINSGAGALVQGTTSYYNALTQVKNIQGAAAAGVPVDVYTASKAGTGTVSTLFANGTVAGIPIWVIVGGLAVFLISGERRR